MISYKSEKLLTIHRPKSESYDVTTIRTSGESRLHWKDLFHKNPIYFRTIADFEAAKEIDISSIGRKTTKFCKQNPKLNGYHIISELDRVLKSGCYESTPGYDIVDWFVNGVRKLGKKWLSFLGNWLSFKTGYLF